VAGSQTVSWRTATATTIGQRQGTVGENQQCQVIAPKWAARQRERRGQFRGGGIVLLVALALVFDDGSGISGMVTAVLLGLVVAVVLAVAVTAAIIMRRMLAVPAPGGARTVIRAVPERDELPGQPPALAPPAIRLHPDQLAELAEIIRRQQAEQ
jgi:hypothetical protein